MQEAAIANVIDLQGGGGFLSLGDLDGDGVAEYVVTQGTRSLAAFDANGELLWEKRRHCFGQVRVHVECEMPTCVYDIDGDGKAEVIARWYLEDERAAVPFLFVFDGMTGEIKHQAALPIRLWPESVHSMAHSGSIVIGHIEHGQPVHVIVAGMCWGLAILDHELRLRFCDPRYGHIWDRMTGWGLCHTPQLCDIDGDGVNELFFGRRAARADGTVLWDVPLEAFSPRQIDHADSFVVADIDGDGRFELAMSNAATVLDAHTGKVLWQHVDKVEHGQQLRLARVRDDVEGAQIVIRDRGRSWIFTTAGEVLTELPEVGGLLNILAWSGNGVAQISLGDHVLDGWGKTLAVLPLARAAEKAGRQWPVSDRDTWGHTAVCDVDGDGLEEVIWISRSHLAVFRNPHPPSQPQSFCRSPAYWLRVANATRY